MSDKPLCAFVFRDIRHAVRHPPVVVRLGSTTAEVPSSEERSWPGQPTSSGARCSSTWSPHGSSHSGSGTSSDRVKWARWRPSKATRRRSSEPSTPSTPGTTGCSRNTGSRSRCAGTGPRSSNTSCSTTSATPPAATFRPRSGCSRTRFRSPRRFHTPWASPGGSPSTMTPAWCSCSSATAPPPKATSTRPATSPGCLERP